MVGMVFDVEIDDDDHESSAMERVKFEPLMGDEEK